MKRIYIIDDHPIVRRGVRDLFETEPDFSVCGEGCSVGDAIVRLGADKPDLVITDLIVDGRSGLDFVRRLAAGPQAPRVLILSTYDAPHYVSRCMAAGARGFVSKSKPTTDLLEAARRILAGRPFVSSSRADGLNDARTATGINQLTDRELEIFLLIGRGFLPRHIAEHLSLSVSTVEVYRQRLKEKLGIGSAPLLLRYAVSWCREHTPP